MGLYFLGKIELGTTTSRGQYFTVNLWEGESYYLSATGAYWNYQEESNQEGRRSRIQVISKNLGGTISFEMEKESYFFFNLGTNYVDVEVENIETGDLVDAHRRPYSYNIGVFFLNSWGTGSISYSDTSLKTRTGKDLAAKYQFGLVFDF